jgi:Type I restriction modification DNA specificity domain
VNKPVRLGDHIAFSNGKTSPARYQGGNYTVWGSNGPIGHADTSNVKGPFVVIGRVGAYCGSLHYAAEDGWVTDNAIICRALDSRLNRFWFYALQTASLNRRSGGSGQPLLNQGILREIRIGLPEPEQWLDIAGVLGALDDLIEANHAISHRAAALAAALAFTSPSRVHLNDLASVADVRQFRPDGPVDHFSIPVFDEGQLPERVDGDAIKSGKLLLTQPSVLVSRLNPQTPRVWMAYPRDVPAAASTEFVPLIAADSAATEEVWAVCVSDEFSAQMRARVTGTTGSHQRVDKAALPELMVADVRLLDSYKRTTIVSLVREAHASLVGAAEAAKTRDELLPLLLAGRVRVGDVAA